MVNNIIKQLYKNHGNKTKYGRISGEDFAEKKLLLDKLKKKITYT